MTALPASEPLTRFTMPAGSEAAEPPERRGLARDAIRLLVARNTRIGHVAFRELADELDPGDLVVVNTSATVPAALDGTRPDGRVMPVHVAAALDDGSWVVEVRRADNSGPADDVLSGEWIGLPGGAGLAVASSYPGEHEPSSRLWRATPSTTDGLLRFLSEHGRPIRYGYLRGKWPLGDLQTVYADEPGSAEMPSAGRPFSRRLLVRLISRGVTVAPLVLHTGVSSPEKHEPPMPERFSVPDDTARLVNSARRAGRRVVAVGTTTARALESAVDADGRVHGAAGWTDLVLSPARPAWVVSGLVTGLHEPQASHLLLLEAVAGSDLVRRAYDEAVAQRYLWHEFGDSMLFLP